MVSVLFHLLIHPASVLAQNGEGSHYQLFLNEIMASNATTITDEDGDAEDWIELY